MSNNQLYWSTAYNCYVNPDGTRYNPHAQQSLNDPSQSNQPQWSPAEGVWVYPNGQRWNPSTQQWVNPPDRPQVQQMPAQSLANIPRGQPSQPYVQHTRGPSSSSHGSVNYQWQAQPAQNTQMPAPVKPLHRNIEGTDGDYEPLDPHYRKHPKNFFKKFRVFMMLWSQPAEDNTISVVTNFYITRDKRHGQPIHSKIRRFIVVKEGEYYCLCVPIVTYEGKGVGKKVLKREHAIVHTSSEPPAPARYELPGRNEKGMRVPIRVHTDERGDKLSDMSRIDYGRVYTVEKNVKVRPFGWIHERSRKDLEYSFYRVFLGEQGYTVWREQLERQQRDLADESREERNTDDGVEGDHEGDDEEERSRHGVDVVNHPNVTSSTSKGKAPARDSTALSVRTRQIPNALTPANSRVKFPVPHNRSQNSPTTMRRLPQQGERAYSRASGPQRSANREAEEEEDDDEEEEDDDEEEEDDEDDEEEEDEEEEDDDNESGE